MPRSHGTPTVEGAQRAPGALDRLVEAEAGHAERLAAAIEGAKALVEAARAEAADRETRRRDAAEVEARATAARRAEALREGVARIEAEGRAEAARYDGVADTAIAAVAARMVARALTGEAS